MDQTETRIPTVKEWRKGGTKPASSYTTSSIALAKIKELAKH